MPVKYTIGKIAEVTGGQLVGASSGIVSRLVFDSRMVFDPEGVLFFALKGGHNDGHRYVSGLYERGVRCFVVDNIFRISEELSEAAFIVVPDTLKALQQLAAAHRAQFDIPVVAITGSNGKTIVKEWLAQVLDGVDKVTRSPRSYNSQIGVPLSVWQLNAASTIAIFEAGISVPGEMPRLEEIIHPTIGIITNIGTAHQENFLSLEQKLHEKLTLFTRAGVVFCSFDQKVIYDALLTLYPEKTILTWGRDAGASLQLLSANRDEATQLKLAWGKETFVVELPFTDAISVENVMPVILFLLYRGFAFSDIAAIVWQLQPVAMRMEQKEGINGSLIINDSYNSDFTSLEVALDFLNQQGLKKGGGRTLILSDMFQTGLDDSVLYPRVAELVRAKGIDRFIGVGNEISRFASHFRSGNAFYASTDALIQALPGFSFRNEAILIKGSRAFAFERVSALLEQKQHATVMEINLNALVNNLNVFRERLKPDTKVLVMVKAFGYGSGSFEIASALQHQKVDYLGVAYADEGMELRQAGITVPIMVMNPEEKSFGQMLQYNLEPEIYSFKLLEAFNKAVMDYGADSVNVHIKVDTGMYRLGFFDDDAQEIAKALQKMTHLRVRSVFTHLAGTDEEVHDDFTRHQLTLFERFCQQMELGIGYKFMRHALNSAGVERFAAQQYEMVRIGIGLYGISATKDARLSNVATLKTYVSQVKTVRPDATIGYGRAGKVPPGGKIAVIPIGYADGLNRHLSNRMGEVLVGKHLVPIVGNVCMDMCMLDVSGLDVSEGDEVIVFGDNHPFTVMAARLNTIPYEILTGISRRVKRVYFRE